MQVVLPEGMTRGGIQSGAGFQIFGGELMVTERTVEQVGHDLEPCAVLGSIRCLLTCALHLLLPICAPFPSPSFRILFTDCV